MNRKNNRNITSWFRQSISKEICQTEQEYMNINIQLPALPIIVLATTPITTMLCVVNSSYPERARYILSFAVCFFLHLRKLSGGKGLFDS